MAGMEQFSNKAIFLPIFAVLAFYARMVYWEEPNLFSLSSVGQCLSFGAPQAWSAISVSISDFSDFKGGAWPVWGCSRQNRDCHLWGSFGLGFQLVILEVGLLLTS